MTQYYIRFDKKFFLPIISRSKKQISELSIEYASTNVKFKLREIVR